MAASFLTMKPENEKTARGVVVAVALSRNGRYLICQRAARKRYRGLWEFPGGKLHDGESLRDCAARELREELGLRVSAVEEAPLFRHLDDGSGYLIEFVAASADGEPELREHVALAWVTPEECMSYPLAPSDAAFAMQALSRM
jgi:mutator protein MutT